MGKDSQATTDGVDHTIPLWSLGMSGALLAGGDLEVSLDSLGPIGKHTVAGARSVPFCSLHVR